MCFEVAFSTDTSLLRTVIDNHQFFKSNLLPLSFNSKSPFKISEFVVNLKNKINQVYILKGSQVGINLDPLFK